MKKATLILVILFSLSSFTPARAQSTLMPQKECDKGAREYVRVIEVAFVYSSHYSKKLDKCFVRVDYLGDKITGEKASIAVFNVFENIMVACYDNPLCFVGAIQCDTIYEFEKLIKPYMEE